MNTHRGAKFEAQEEMERLMAECDAGNLKRLERNPPSTTVMLNEVLRFYRRKGRKSLEHTERHVRRIKSGFAGKRADEITADHVNEYAER